MKTPSELFQEHIQLIVSNPGAWRELFCTEAVYEFPYAPSVGAPGRYEGIDAIFNHVQTVFSQLSDLHLKLDVGRDVKPMADGKSVFAEFELAATVTATGTPYNQKYVVLMTADQGKIVLLREWWNPQEVLKSFSAVPGS